MEVTSLSLLAVAALTVSLYHVCRSFYWHPLARFSGPRLAALTTLYRAYYDCLPSKSFVHHLAELHRQYGDIVRIGPNELHFHSPAAYLEIYNPSNRWDKEKNLYHSMGEDRSSFGYLTYREAKERKDILSRRFSRKAVLEAHGIVEGIVTDLCKTFESNAGQPIDLHYAFRCMSMDVITYLCFAKSVDAVHAPKYEAPIILAMDASQKVFVCFKHSSLYKNMIFNCPPKLSKILSPSTVGLVDLQTLLRAQIKQLTSDPSELEKLPHKTTIYHELLKPEAYKAGTAPSSGSLYEESQALMFGGADTTGMTLMHGSFYILRERVVYSKLKEELRQAWPVLGEPLGWEALEKLPYLTAVIKESLRISPGVASPLPRVVPEAGAVVTGVPIPGGTVVGHTAHFVHSNPTIFDRPDEFIPERWMGEDAKANEKWLLSFSRGPRSCLGIHPRELKWKDAFLPDYSGPHLRARMVPETS
ncbi:hypothetical protein BDV06DRAFT_233850 [Aspergillus oleicola]